MSSAIGTPNAKNTDRIPSGIIALDKESRAYRLPGLLSFNGLLVKDAREISVKKKHKA